MRGVNDSQCGRESHRGGHPQPTGDEGTLPGRGGNPTKKKERSAPFGYITPRAVEDATFFVAHGVKAYKEPSRD